ncbi:MAG TPA: hypothetical protein VF843_00805 [Streptosporangiaceae bacterium]
MIAGRLPVLGADSLGEWLSVPPPEVPPCGILASAEEGAGRSPGWRMPGGRLLWGQLPAGGSPAGKARGGQRRAGAPGFHGWAAGPGLAGASGGLGGGSWR